jgi:tRNA U34 5-methylaminomethyl-2-thiouridine-forming methyltransferase MnmC
MNFEFEIVYTEDGSPTVRDPETGELHHNRAGAYTEALVNYIQPAGILRRSGGDEKVLSVLDVCFGCGYNTFVLLNELMTLDVLLEHHKLINIVAIERDQAVLSVLSAILQFSKFAPIHKSFPQPVRFGTHRFALPNGVEVCFELIQDDIRKAAPTFASASDRSFDLIFHDGFSPKHVPELWTVDLFKCYRSLLDARKGMVLTYSSASAVRGGLRDAGFSVWRSTAVGGKSGGTVGSVRNDIETGEFIFSLSDEEARKMHSGSGIPYRDPEFELSRDAIRSQRLSEQFLLRGIAQESNRAFDDSSDKRH